MPDTTRLGAFPNHTEEAIRNGRRNMDIQTCAHGMIIEKKITLVIFED
ncbi:hypothetical protein J7L05_05795 [bacterium]|nr:hypothetical protein [bacterium]